jgi:hypothetical protein
MFLVLFRCGLDEKQGRGLNHQKDGVWGLKFDPTGRQMDEG